MKRTPIHYTVIARWLLAVTGSVLSASRRQHRIG
jgi:hypothetical protein